MYEAFTRIGDNNKYMEDNVRHAVAAIEKSDLKPGFEPETP